MAVIDWPRVGLGGGPLGNLFEPVDDEAARATVEAAWARGVRLFDTAPFYGSGLSERRLGAVLRDYPRDDFVLSTKVGRLLRPGQPDPSFPGASPLGAVFDFSYDGAMRSLEESLERLGLDRVDVALIHDPQDHVDEALAGSYHALERLREEGTVRAIGVGLNYVEPLVRFGREADIDCMIVAGRFTLLERQAEPELLPLCEERGISVIAAGVLNSGVLAGGTTFEYGPASPEVVQRVRNLEGICASHGVALAAAALQFPLRHPAVAAVLVGARSPAEVEDDLDLVELPIPDELWTALDA
jgi:D-threo-aldose 1-dehydrogenase